MTVTVISSDVSCSFVEVEVRFKGTGARLCKHELDKAVTLQSHSSELFFQKHLKTSFVQIQFKPDW